MINCKECGIEIRAETHKPPIWGVQEVRAGRVKTYYFCSEKHGNDWVGKQSGYKLVRKIIDA